MPRVVFHKNGRVFSDDVPTNTNLVVQAGVRRYPFPHLRYECGMGKCSKCACIVLSGAELLPPPNWKEKKLLGDRLTQGWRLICQQWIQSDIELQQDEADTRALDGAATCT